MVVAIQVNQSLYKLIIAWLLKNTIRRESDMADIIRIILSVLIPPLGVFLQVGIGTDFWINILLTLLGYIPGLVHAIWVIARK